MKTCFLFLIFSAIYSQAESIAVKAPTKEWADAIQVAARDLGVEKGEPITNGFVFVDGSYISPPYRVTRAGNAILVNNVFIDSAGVWPIPPRSEKTYVKKIPEMPKSITENTSKFDKELTDYLSGMTSYLEYTYGKDDMVNHMVDVFKSLPCVIEARRSGHSVIVSWKSDSPVKEERIRLIPPTRRPVEWTQEKVISAAKELRINYENRLKLGDYYFLSPNGRYSRMTGTKEGAVGVLSQLLPLLSNSQTSNSVFTRMKETTPIYFSESAAKAFFENRDSITPELKTRIENLKESLNVHRKPSPIPDLTLEIPPAQPQKLKPTVVNLKMY